MGAVRKKLYLEYYEDRVFIVDDEYDLLFFFNSPRDGSVHYTLQRDILGLPKNWIAV